MVDKDRIQGRLSRPEYSVLCGLDVESNFVIRSCLWGPRTLISHLSTREFYLPAVKRRLKLAAAAGPSLRQLSHAA
jgi:hypothetical protein